MNLSTNTKMGIVGVVCVAAGAALGVAATYKYFEKKFDDAWESEVEYLNSRKKEVEINPIDDTNINSDEKIDDEDDEDDSSDLVVNRITEAEAFEEDRRNYMDAYISKTHAYNTLIDETTIKNASVERPTEEDQHPEPYVIDPDEFVDENFNYDKLAYTYLVEDGTLLDEDEDVVDDIERSVGIKNLEVFAKHEELSMLYIRNDATFTDYEIEKVFASYETYAGRSPK